MNTTHLIGAEDVLRAGRQIDGAAETMRNAADTMDRAGTHLAQAMDEAVTRFVGNLAEHDAERPTLRDRFAAKAMQGMLPMDTDNGRERSAGALARCAELSYRMADEMLKARAR